MTVIRFSATFGHEIKTVELKEVSGTGGLWFLLIDNFYVASFRKNAGTWECGFQDPPGWVTSADMQVLCDMIASNPSC